MILSPAFLKERVEKTAAIRKIRGQNFAGPVFLVGGALRELALGRAPNDYDFALGRSEDLEVFEKAFGARSFLLGKKPIQTHRMVAGDLSVDVTIIEESLEEDLRRRDLTVNALAYAIGEGVVIDPFHGLKDAEKRILRSPREGSLREDPLRMVKAARHLSALRGFVLDPALKAAIALNKKLIGGTAAERIKYELDLIMTSPNPYKGIRTMEETRLLFELFPELLSLEQMDVEKHLTPKALRHTLDGFKYMGRIKKFDPSMEKETKCAGYGLLFHDLGKPRTFSRDEASGHVHFYYHERHSSEMATAIMDRLRFSIAETRCIAGIIERHMRIFLISSPEATERATRRLVYKMEWLTPALVFLTLLDLYGNTKGRENPSTRQVRNRCREVLAAYGEWRREPLPPIVTGNDLLALGFAQGPALGRVLQEIREKQIAGEISEKEEALRYAAARQEA